MYISKKDREIIKNKFSGRCAYSGTLLEDDWQIDHIKAIKRNSILGSCDNAENHNILNMFPAQKIINHYKHSYSIEDLRYLLNGLHERISKLVLTAINYTTCYLLAFINLKLWLIYIVTTAIGHKMTSGMKKDITQYPH